ncbi:MAG: sugar phosphate isomerase/epimerase [Clostridia bacterium]|nr:sugar phosphate isomerase/epimerase [Clostridia bacterium]
MEKKVSLRERLFVSTTADDCCEEARRFRLGLEIAEFCWAQRIDRDREENIDRVKRLSEGIPLGWFHAPFAELAPCAIDPRARLLAAERYRQSIGIALQLGIKRLVIHGGFIPEVYFPEYYVEQSILFWKEFLASAPEDITIALENVMEPSPETLVSIVGGVGDPRIGLCFDVGHANCSVSSVPPIDWIGPMAPHLFHVHLHNNAGGRDLHSPLGEGNIPIERIIDIVAALRPEATFTVENMHCGPSIEWLADKGYLEK